MGFICVVTSFKKDIKRSGIHLAERISMSFSFRESSGIRMSLVLCCPLYSGSFAKLVFFPNSHAMGSCKTNRRTGAVRSPSELVGGWCPGHVLMASGSCDAGVPVMF